MRNGRLVWGWILIGVGVVLLLERFGALAGLRLNFWSLFWGLLLVGLGLSALWQGLRPRAGAVGGVGASDVPVQELSVPLEGALRARLELRHGAGRLTAGSGASADQLLAGSFAVVSRVNKRSEGDALVVELSQAPETGMRVVFPWNIPPQGGLRWDVRLNQSVPLALDIRGGANEIQLDLSDLLVTDLRLETGASSTRVDLPSRAEHTRVTVRSGAASVALRVPPGVAARIRSRGGLASLKVDESRFPRMGEVFQSPDYETAAHVVEIDTEAGMASIEVR